MIDGDSQDKPENAVKDPFEGLKKGIFC